MSDKAHDLRQMERTLAREAMRAMSGPATAAQVPAAAPSATTAAVPAPSPPAAADTAATSVLGPTLRFRGELRADEDFTLHGQIEGSIHHSKNLCIGPDGIVRGDSRALTIVVEGTVEGDLYALESISVRTTARVTGNIFAPRVSIADGASFNGKIDMASSAKAARSITHRKSETVLSESQVVQTLASS